MQPPEFSGRTLSDRAFEWLEEAIIKGDYPAGTKLDEVELAKAFGVSRGPVREAIRRLEGRKLVDRVAHIGVRVAERSQADLIDLLYVREALEGMACRLATTRISEKSLGHLEGLLLDHSELEPLQAGSHYFQKSGDTDFHYRIIQESKNKRLIDLLCGDIYYLLRGYRYKSSARKGRPHEALDEHRKILSAMQSRNADLAEATMRKHISHSRIEAEKELNNHIKPPKIKP